MDRIAIGLWGSNGHQIHGKLQDYPQLKLVAVGQLAKPIEQKLLAEHPDAVVCSTFEQMLGVAGLQLVSLCSQMRSEQADEAIAALQAGVHVYAEKPCATREADLDRILATVAQSKATFHEMADTVFAQPYWAMRQLIAEGVIGEVVQVSTQKSYPMHERRPLSEKVDGGQIAQNGVHAMRFVEHITGLQAVTVQAMQTGLGEMRADSDLQMASTVMGQLSNGGLFSIIANYLNPTGFGSWGNEMVRIFGTKGMVESTDGGKRTRLVVGDEDRGPLDTSVDAPDWLTMVLDDVQGCSSMLIDLETELHPTRMVLRARSVAQQINKP